LAYRGHINHFALRNKAKFPVANSDSKFKLNLAVDGALISLAAGAVAGSIGVGAAYPLDALKTKAQTYATANDGNSSSTSSPGLLKMVQIVLKEEGIGEHLHVAHQSVNDCDLHS
jgi:hypothetical protein